MTNPASAESLKQEIRRLYLDNGSRAYGLYDLNQLQHALQSAQHAEAQGFSAGLIMACLLHDVGHMVHRLGEAPAEDGVDDQHEDLGAQWLAEHFPAEVSEPVRLHVAAKRYLCAVEDGYEASLSRDSALSLALQGGRMNAAEQKDFLNTPSADEAIALRRIDDRAKDPKAVTHSIEVFLDRYLIDALQG
ncbi:HD domain-containing protein [Asticcacaulis tiandongensis]|uniref:HD domain-containing protein n=1 Tax=Asticcacaulis tiandongensis TaxID=2565365 RepID=UPI00112E97F8|nr:HD domain-containing protein [Asticcacaulis tiandongensis]